ncbi:alpha/beta hydrolase [Micromonospora sp. WMMD1102]|uniref:alpha/beta hydrolase n=1 Tax=Micromonospora sp. WMMD1102 TaxID=3016105 RepID=UPI0024150BCC|nr:alpha/beta hydrolase [Micromonospora sp. WMMD1102]MDG4790910.1 alpha/beta hydrolase [Micromonospora sp. WMMD1102]
MLPGSKPPAPGAPSGTSGRRAPRRTAVVLAGLATSLALTVPPATAGPAAGPAGLPSGAPGQVVEWHPCPDDSTAECGTLAVPVDWKRPDGPRFQLSLARRTATDPATRIGTLFFGPGGPGDSGVDRIVEGAGRFGSELRSRFDIVSFDPRGVGRSNPVRCSTELLVRRPAPVLTSQQDFDATVAYNRRLRADCRARTGPLFDHVDTSSTARDVDAVRAALGESTLTFHGSSYGTLLGQRYAELFPHRIRAMVLESVLDHSVGTRDFLNAQTSAAQDSFDAFVDWCDRTEGCALHGRDVRTIWADLLGLAGRGEVPDPDDPSATLTPYALSGFLAPRALYEPHDAELAETIAGLAGLVPAGPAGAALPGWRGESTGTGSATETDPQAIFCQDWELPIRNYREYAARLREMARIGTDLPYPRALAGVEACLGAPRVEHPQHRLRVRVDHPILLLNAVHDPVTGYDWATSVARQLGRYGVLLSYEGAGHGVYTATECTRGTVDRYLVDLVVPPRGASCPAAHHAAFPAR